VSGSGIVTIGLYVIKKRADCLDRTFSLHREFSSFDFIKARQRAYVLLANNRAKTFMDFVKEPAYSDDLTCLLRILTFYEHLSVSICSGYIDQTATLRYFGMVFVWWYKNYFNTERGLRSTGWELKSNIDELYLYLQKHAKKKTFQQWIENANEGSRLEAALYRDGDLGIVEQNG
jgi:hypothetical protein